MAEHHPNKEVSGVIEYALGLGWRFARGSGHCYGTLRCPQADRSGCQFRIFSTPQNPGNHARRIRREIDSCLHRLHEEES
jgi:hypothetical protein